MNKTSKLHMSTEEFRKAGYKAVDWIADYYEHIEDYPVFPQVQPVYSTVSMKFLTLE